MSWTRVVLSAQIVLALGALGLYMAALRVTLPGAATGTFFVVPPNGLTEVCALLLVTGAGGLAASYMRRAWPRRVAYAALLVPAALELAAVGSEESVSGMSTGPASLVTMLRLFTWAYRSAGVAALLALAAAVVLVVQDVRGRSYPQPGDPGARRPAAPD